MQHSMVDIIIRSYPFIGIVVKYQNKILKMAITCVNKAIDLHKLVQYGTLNNLSN